MGTALEELRQLETLGRIERRKSLKEGRSTLRVRENRRAARAQASMLLEGLVDDMKDKTSTATVLRMMEAAGVKLTRSMTEAAKRGDAEMARIMAKFVESARRALIDAADAASKELRDVEP